MEALGGTPLLLCLETDDVEGAVAKAVNAGEVAEEDAGDGTCCGGCWTKVKDPFGFVWAIGSSSKAIPIEADEAQA